MRMTNGSEEHVHLPDDTTRETGETRSPDAMRTAVAHSHLGAAPTPPVPLVADPADDLPWQDWTVLPQLDLADLDAGLPDLTRLQTQILANREIRGAPYALAFARADWRADPPLPHGLLEAVDRVARAVAAGERIVVFGDYDADGVTSCAVLWLALRAAGANARAFIPQRDDDGRGLNIPAVHALATDGTTLILTTDCGSSNVAEVRLAHELGIDVIVTDHHPPQGELPPAFAVVNPRQAGCPSPSKDLAGVGVAFRVAEAVLDRVLGADAADELESLLGLVAIGTIGDLVPLTPANWALAHRGLARLNQSPRAGVRALALRAGLTLGAITERDVSFALVPRLNAAGRMGDPRLALDLLITEDHDQAERLAARLHEVNEERQRLTDDLMIIARAQAKEQAREAVPSVVVARGEDWPAGVLGLVAARLSEDYGRPAMAVSCQDGECRGSLRGPVGLNLVEALASQAHVFRRFGGHAQAAGFTLASVDLPVLVDHLRAAATAAASPAPADVVAPTAGDALGVGGALRRPVGLRIDCRLPLCRAADPATYAAVRALAPFGPGFNEPIFLARGVRVARAWCSGPEGRNLRMILREPPHGGGGPTECSAFWGRQGRRLAALRRQGIIDIAYTLDLFPARPGYAAEYTLRVVAARPSRPADQPIRDQSTTDQPPT
ncbi:MAG TPA: single-stranded-DNA-specific exonuclease RecJ [Ktedonobacterales bacterium]|jgi:single-stranded-DNA-specific exonuclease